MPTKLHFIFFMFSLDNWIAGQVRQSKIKLNYNGFDNIVVGIHHSVMEEASLLTEIKAKLTEASLNLHEATYQRAFFRNVKILIPSTWKNTAAKSSALQIYKDADIVIEPDPVRAAYVQTYRGCGEPGSHIRIRPELFTDPKQTSKYGPTDKLLVHEWGHFRWGVFDEYSTTPHDQFYVSPITGDIEATRCSNKIKGRTFKTQGGKVSVCPKNKQGVYDKGCTFQPYTGPLATFKNKDVKASYMDRQYAENIKTFCRSAQPGVIVPDGELHDPDSPSKHNRMCGGQSTMDVILKSPDFTDPNTKKIGGINTPRPLGPTEHIPTFTVLRSSVTKYAIALDASYSMMADNKVSKVRRALKTMTSSMSDESEVALMTYNDSPTTVLPLSRLGDPGIKQQITAAIPNTTSGGTGTGNAILHAIRLLSAGGRNPGGSILRIITDGRENREPRTSNPQIQAEVKKSGIRIDVVTLSEEPDFSLVQIIKETGGRLFADVNQDGITTLETSMRAIQEDSPYAVILQDTVDLIPEASERYNLYTASRRVEVDLIYWGDTAPEVDGADSKHNSLHLTCDHSLQLNSFSCHLVSTAPIGYFSLMIRNNGTESMTVSTSVVEEKNNTGQVKIQAWLGDSQVTNTGDCVEIYTSAASNGRPLLGLNVTSTLQIPDSPPSTIALWDTGSGVDVVRGDGIYSRAFCDLPTSGRYSVSVRVHNWQLQAVFRTDQYNRSTDSNDTRSQFIRISEPFSRSLEAGAFVYKPKSNREDNTIRDDSDEQTRTVTPGQVTDLTVIKVSGSMITVIWTAPGHVQDSGKADRYEARVCRSALRCANKFGSCTRVQLTDESELVTTPSESGTKQTARFTSSIAGFFCLRAVNSNGVRGLVSNAAPFSLNIKFDLPVTDEVEYLDSHRIIQTEEAVPGVSVAIIAGVLCLVVLCGVVAVVIMRRRMFIVHPEGPK